MKKAIRSAIRYSLAIALFAGCVSSKKFEMQVKTSDDLKTQKESLLQELGEAKYQNQKLSEQLEALLKAKKELESSLGATKDDLKSTIAKLSKLNEELERTKKELEQRLQEVLQAKESEIRRLTSTYDQMVGELKNEISSGEIKITQLQNKLTVNLVDKILFDSGKTEIKENGKKVLDRVGAILKQVKDRQVVIEGHTDNVPVGPSLRVKFPTNWELSASRATAVARYLQENAGMDPESLMAAGHGPYKPIAPNDSPENKAQNRRIEIVLIPKDLSKAPTPQATSPAAPSAPAAPDAPAGTRN